MTRANFREGHPNVPWNPNIVGHQQKQVGKKVFSSLEERTVAIREEIIKNKTNEEANDILSNP